METIETKEKCQGKCPSCDKENLDYKAIVLQDDFVYFPFTCNDCNVEGKEYYAIQYSETDYFTNTVIKDGDVVFDKGGSHENEDSNEPRDEWQLHAESNGYV